MGVFVDLQHETEAEQFGLILGTAMHVAEEADSWMWWCHVQRTPVTGHTGPEGSRKLRFLDFLTTAQYGGRLSALRTGRFYPQVYSWNSFSLGAESTPGPRFGRKEMCH